MQGNAEGLINEKIVDPFLNLDEQSNNSDTQNNIVSDTASENQLSSPHKAVKKDVSNHKMKKSDLCKSALKDSSFIEQVNAKKHYKIKEQVKMLMEESKDKGIIQRTIDIIYRKFHERQDLVKNCEIKISFLEIYNDRVIDLLDGLKEQLRKQRKIVKKLERSLNMSMGNAAQYDAGL